jgi:HTH-type transcriptional regulator, sugar sensing transcriptional regulator
MSIIRDLQKFNLSDAEAKVYIAALELGDTTIERIAIKSGLKRTTAYGIVHSLQEKKLLTRSKNRKKNVYAEDPRTLRENVDEKLSTLEHLLPQLLAISSAVDIKPKVRFLQGRDVIEKIHIEAFVYPGREYVVWIPGKVFDQDLDLTFWNQYYMPKRLALKIPVRFIIADVPSASDFKKTDDKWLKKTRITSATFIEVICILYGGKHTAFISSHDNTAFVIDSDAVYNTLFGFFEMQWEALAE